MTCQPGGQCVIAGLYKDSTGGLAALGIVESHGTFPTVEQIPLPANSDGSFAEIRSVSCEGSGQCVIVGAYRPKSGRILAMSAVESGGAFKAFTEITATPPNAFTATLAAVSCTPARQCVAVGYYYDLTEHEHPYAVFRSATGHWGHATVVQSPPGAATIPLQADGLDGVSCASRGCTAAGFYTSAKGAALPMAAARP